MRQVQSIAPTESNSLEVTERVPLKRQWQRPRGQFGDWSWQQLTQANQRLGGSDYFGEKY